MCFDFDSNQSSAEKMPVPFEVLAQSAAYQELWITDSKVTFSELAFGQQWVSDDFLVILMTPESSDIEAISRQVYQQALSQARLLGFKSLIRTWNFFPRINDHENGLERYQHFCVARQDVLNHFPEFQAQNPAATAIGTHREENNFVFLFAKTKGKGLENNRQMSAWEYPPHYAPKQPRFARAMWHSGLLICSGTASVVGHETHHKGDVVKQFNESVLNVQTLLEQSEDKVEIHQGVFRFYLRNPDDIPQVLTCLAESKINHYVVLAADVCREDLLIECEAVFQK